MSREVDQRVVEMRFDNAQFEKNTRESMKTLDRLQEKLQFKDVDKGFENIEKAQRNVNFDEMEGALDTLKVKFNALDVMAVAALTNITNKIVDTGERLVKSLSVDQVASGWNKYTEKTSNVQTIMNATGESIDNVNGYLNKLMWYSDETSYSFSEMTSALSQMTAAGGDIKKMIPMIMGIANATADAGKTGFAFQSTIRNLIQSYSAGHLQLQDWKSLNLMGTATKALKQELIDTAVEMGKLKEGEVTIATFESTLSNKWADTKVMEKTFEKYASMMEAAYDMVQQNPGMTSSEALEKLSGQYGELAERAALAAQQATSFEQAIDSTKDAVSSSWMKIFETFFGNKEEATETWTELANRLYDIFVPSINALNERLKEGLDTGWKQLNDKLGDQAETYDTVLQKVALASGAVTEESIEEAGSFANALRDGGVNAELLQNGLDVTLVSLEKYLAMSDEALDARNLDKEAIERDYEALSRLNEEFRTGEASLADYAAGMSELSGREHLMQSLWNIMDALSALVQPIHDAFQEIFPPTSGKQIKSFAEGLDSITKKLIISDETAKKIKTAAEGVFSVLRVGKDILEGIISGVARVLTLAKPLADVLLDVASAAGEFVSEITNGLHPLESIGAWVTDFVDAAAPVLYSFGSVADKIFMQFAQSAKDAFNEFDPEKLNQFILGGMGASMLVSVKGFFESIKAIGSSAKDVVGGIKDCIESLGEAVDAWKSAKKADTLMTVAKAVSLMAGSLAVLSMVKADRLGAAIGALTVTFGELLGVMAVMPHLTKNVKSLKLSVLAGGMVAVSAAILVLSGALKVISSIDSDKLFGSVVALGSVMAELTVIAVILSRDGGRFTKGAAGMIAFAAGIRILASSVKALGGLSVTALAKGIAGAGALCAELVFAAKLMNGTKFGIGKGTGFVLVAASMEILQDTVAKFGEMDWESIGRGLLAMAGGLGACVAALNLSKGTIGGAISLTMMAAAVNLLVPALQGLGNLSWETIGKGLLTLIGAFAVMGGAAVILTPVTPVIVALSLSLSALALSLGALLALNSASMFIGNLASSLSLLNGLNFQVFLNGIKSVAWLLVEFIAGVFEGLAKVSSSLVGSIATIIASICDAIVLAAPSIGNALYVVGVTVIDTVVKLLAYVWEKIEPALDDLWEKFTTWAGNHNPLDPKNWGGQDKGVSAQAFVLPFADIMDELKNGDSVAAGLYQLCTSIGKNASKGVAEGQLESKNDAADASEEVANAVIDTSKKTLDVNSPSKVMAQIGQYVTLGLAQGIADPIALAQAKASMLHAATAIRNVFTTFWGIHSPSDVAASDAENIIEGAILGIGDKTKQDELRQASYSGALVMKDGALQAIDETILAVQKKIPELYDAFKQSSLRPGNLLYQNGLSDAMNDFSNAMDDTVIIPGKTGLKRAGGSRNATKAEIAGAKQGNADVQKNPYGILSSLYQKTQDTINDALPTVTPTTSKGGTTKVTKTEADKLVDEYTKKLKANKAKMDAADKEYALWELTEGDTSSVEALVEKKTDSLTQAIADQTDRVAIAKEQYDKILAEKSSTDTQKSDAYATYLNEEKTLAELKGKKQATLFQVIKDRYDDEASTATDEYELWASLYEDTATVEEKSNKKIENLNKKIGIQAKVVTAAEEEYTTLKAEFGEESLKTQEAYRKWLEEQKEQQDLINEMNQAQLDAFDDALAMLEKQEKIITNRQNVLKKIYNDGDLSQREEAYKAAVKQYGADSKEARLASTQGTMTAILGVGTALDSMAYSVKKLTNKQNKYNEAVKQSGKDSEAALDALAEWQGEQYNFVGFAEDLATTFDLDDSGKRMTMQLGYAIARNWKPIQKGFQDVWQKVQTKFPQAAQNMANAFGLVVREGATEVITDVYSMITAAVGGDWGQALTSGIAAVLDFMGSDFGKTVLDTVGPMLATAGKKLSGTLAATLGGVVSEGGLLTTIGTKLAGLAATIGGEGGILATVGAKLAALAASLGPHGLLIAAVVAAGAVVITLLVKNWDKVKNFFGRALDWLRNLFSKFVEVGKNLVKGLWEGITGAAKAVGDGIKNLCTGLVNRVKSFFGIHSPSTVMAQLGEYMSLGFANGIADSGNAVDRSMNDVMRSALRAAQMSADMILSCFDEDADFRPTITPVVDLEGVRNSANWMQSAFADPDGTLNARFEQPTQLMRSFAKRREIQNGEPTAAAASGNDDVVAAIESLGSRVDAVSEAVRNMKLSIDRRKLVGEIIEDVDTKLMERAERRRR